ncbi:response regulator transcription factor [Methylococcus sp. EFPC2]|uniref:response regulator transcription factor n=1 Tax=Methylococcus sp. EFPC2 TaxID=2812648 RepID=UPI001967378A|nr:response regulator transcription factor [Methylococcus sp. EFPC2]
MRLLLIEDDPVLSASLQTDLERSGFVVDMAADGETGEFLGATESYDAAILDLGLPKLPGLEVLRRWRAADNALPVIILTARDAWYEKVDGLKAGADDYLGKPFHIEELIARLQAMLKRRAGLVHPQLEMYGIKLDEERQTVTIDGTKIMQLTALEFRLLRYFMLHPRKVLSKAHLVEHVYGREIDPDSNVLEVYINRLRRMLDKDLITTRRGQGYVFGHEP